LVAFTEAGNVVYEEIQRLSPHDDAQGNLKAQATTLAIELGQTRSLLVAQSGASVSMAMLIILVSWLVVIFLGFSVLAPRNATAVVALVVSGSRCIGRYFPDPGTGSTISRPDRYFQPADAEHSASAREMTSVRA
jgi:hypothetical protein